MRYHRKRRRPAENKSHGRSDAVEDRRAAPESADDERENEPERRLSALLQLFLYWRDLATPSARAEFLRTLAFGFFLLGVMVGGMLARYFWKLFQSGRSVAEADATLLVLPLVVSLMVPYPLWTMVSGATKNSFAIVAAFQNGFVWQALLSGIRPFP